MQKLYHFSCPKCNNSQNFYRYGKDKSGFQKYQCLCCGAQFAPDNPSKHDKKNYPICAKCGKATFLHHDYEYYLNYRCGDKKCNHSMFAANPTAIVAPSMSKLFG